MESKFWEDVNEGDELPNLEFGPLTVKTFFLMFAGTRDPNPQHHNRDWNKAMGSRDMFATTPWHQALFARFATDWTGPESDFRATSLSMGTQVCPGDKLEVSGKIAQKYREGDDCRVLIEMLSASQLGIAARATATMAMPSRDGGEVKVLTNVAKTVVEPHPEVPDWAKQHLGKVSPKAGSSAYPVSETQITYWCDMIENGNPLYADGEYARNSRHKGVIAPGPSLMIWTFGRPGQSADMDNPDHKPWPPIQESAAQAGGGYLEPPDCPLVIATNSVQEYGVPLRPGDRLYTTNEFVNCTPLKRTHLGLGYFTTNLSTYYNQKDEIVTSALFTMYRYRLADKEEAS